MISEYADEPMDLEDRQCENDLNKPPNINLIGCVFVKCILLVFLIVFVIKRSEQPVPEQISPSASPIVFID